MQTITTPILPPPSNPPWMTKCNFTEHLEANNIVLLYYVQIKNTKILKKVLAPKNLFLIVLKVLL